MIHAFKLRPYHNPEDVDESKVPDGWRFRYADEMSQKDNDARWFDCTFRPYRSIEYGRNPRMTYIVPV